MKQETVKLELSHNEVSVILRPIGEVLITNKEPADLSGLGVLSRAIAVALAEEEDELDQRE